MASEHKPKRFYQHWWFWLIIVLVVGWWMISGTEEDSSSTEDHSTESNNSPSSSKEESSGSFSKTANVHFSDTSGDQTTKIDKIYVKDISDYDAVDDDMNEIKYAIVIPLTVTNQAKEDVVTYPEQGHVVFPDGTQIKSSSLDSNLKDVWDSLDDVAPGATKKGNVYFPLTDKQAKTIKEAVYQFEVMCGDENMTTKDYRVDFKF